MEEKQSKKSTAVSAVGRRKEAIARLRLVSGNGQMTINGKAVGEYFPGAVSQKLYQKPLEITKTSGKYTISVKVKGGGQVSQLGAVIHGLSRALAQANPEVRVALKREGLLTRDARVKERRKYGHAGKARAMKQSPKR